VRTRPTILYYSPDADSVPGLIRQWAEANAFPMMVLGDAGQVESIILRGAPVFLFIDADRMAEEGMAMVQRLKRDAFTGIVPVTMLSQAHQPALVEQWFAAGTDEVLTEIFSPAEQRARLDAMLVRTVRDVSVHPSTRLPGTTEIEREIRRQLTAAGEFAVCYADLDHFKEFNDRYSYYDGDRVIYIVSRILHDVVRGLVGPGGFVGHIGGDDFIFVIPLEHVSPVCTEILHVFDTLVPFQYNEQDRRAGYFFGKDRRGQLHRVPLMTLSIGIVTNKNRSFAHPAQVSELATEMKSYAKTLPGSIFVVDRRRGDAEGEQRGDLR
jgi:GGDEF domain-containing protein